MDNRTSSKSPIKQSERRKATVMFADISGFTAMSEKLDAEEVTSVMNECFEILVDKVKKYNGTIDKFIGDCIMSLYGLPSAIENAPMKAVNTAIEMRESLYKFNKEKDLKIPLDIHIGITTGEVISGEVGASDKKEYTVMGDSVNLASRLEDASTKGQILVCPETYNLTKNDFEYNKLPPLALKGKEKPVAVYELLSRKEKMYRAQLGYERIIQSEMIGRDKELNRVESALNNLIDKKGSIIAIIGEAGIGKSRLLAELREKDIVKKTKILEGRAISIGKNLSFHPIIDFLKNWAEIMEDDTTEESINKLENAIKNTAPNDLKEIFPFTATMMGMKLKGEYAERVKGIEGEALAKLILKNIKDLLAKISEEKPLLIILEDLHWADMSSIEFFESFYGLSEKNSIMFIILLRSGYEYTGDRIIKYLGEKYQGDYTEILLQPLDKTQSEKLVDNLLKIKGLSAGIKQRIIERSEGNPFFIEEVVRSFIDTGVVKEKNGRFEVTDKIDVFEIPYTINELIMIRIDRLDNETRNLLCIASVIGRNFFYRILYQVARDIQGIDNKLDYLKGIQLIQERIRMAEVEYLFKHALAQNAIYESILISTRRKLHFKVALAVEEVFRERLSEFYGLLTHHYCQAEDMDKAEEYLTKAGEVALKSSASSEALVFYKEALDLYVKKFGDKVDKVKMAGLEKNIAISLHNKCYYIEAIKHFDKVLEYLGEKTPKNIIIILCTIVSSVIKLLKTFYLPSKKQKRSPTQRENEILDLREKRCTALMQLNQTKTFMYGMIILNRYLSFDIAKIKNGVKYCCNLSKLLSSYGILFGLCRKIIEFIIKYIDEKDIKNIYYYTDATLWLNFYCGNWIDKYNKKLVEYCLSNYDITSANIYIAFFGCIKIEQGNLKDIESLIKKVYEIGYVFGIEATKVLYHELYATSMLKIRDLNNALDHINNSISISMNLGQYALVPYYDGIKANIEILLGHMQDAEKTLNYIMGYVKSESILVPHKVMPYLKAQFLFNLTTLDKSIKSGNRNIIIKYRKKTLKSAKKAVTVAKKYALGRTEIYRLMAIYYWLCNQEHKALKWFDKSIKEGKRLGARPELSRTFFEVGKRLLEPKSKYKALNGINAEEYLTKAEDMFKEMALEWDLKELEKVQSQIQQQQSGIQK